MNDVAFHARYRIEAMGGIDQTEIVFLNRFLRRALHNRGGDYITPSTSSRSDSGLSKRGFLHKRGSQ